MPFPDNPAHQRLDTRRVTLYAEHISDNTYRYIEIPDSGLCTTYTRHCPSPARAVGKFINWTSFYSPGTGPAADYVMVMQDTTPETISTHKCPLCNSNMAERQGKFGKFYACTAWSKTKCPGTLNKDGKPSKKILAMMTSKKSISKSKVKEDKSVESPAIDMLDL